MPERHRALLLQVAGTCQWPRYCAIAGTGSLSDTLVARVSGCAHWHGPRPHCDWHWQWESRPHKPAAGRPAFARASEAARQLKGKLSKVPREHWQSAYALFRVLCAHLRLLLPVPRPAHGLLRGPAAARIWRWAVWEPQRTKSDQSLVSTTSSSTTPHGLAFSTLAHHRFYSSCGDRMCAFDSLDLALCPGKARPLDQLAVLMRFPVCALRR